MFINPINWSEKITIIIPAIILKISEFFKSACPKNEAEAPKIINTLENPKQNRTRGNKFIFLESNMFCKDWPEI